MKKLLLLFALSLSATPTVIGQQALIGTACSESPDMQGGSVWTRPNTDPAKPLPRYFVCGYVRQNNDALGTVSWTAQVSNSDSNITKTTYSAAVEWLKAQPVPQ